MRGAYQLTDTSHWLTDIALSGDLPAKVSSPDDGLIWLEFNPKRSAPSNHGIMPTPVLLNFLTHSPRTTWPGSRR